MLNPKYLAAIKKFRLIDDTFFSICFDNNVPDVEYILRIILDKPDLIVLVVQTQKSVENIYGRSVRFDVFATDDKGKSKYNEPILAQFLRGLDIIPSCLTIIIWKRTKNLLHYQKLSWFS